MWKTELSDRIRKIADRISRKLYNVIDDLPALIDFENERLHENPVAHAIRTLEIVPFRPLPITNLILLVDEKKDEPPMSKS